MGKIYEEPFQKGARILRVQHFSPVNGPVTEQIIVDEVAEAPTLEQLSNAQATLNRIRNKRKNFLTK